MFIVNKFKIVYKSKINNYINKLFIILFNRKIGQYIYNIIIFNIMTPNKVFYDTNFKSQ